MNMHNHNRNETKTRVHILFDVLHKPVIHGSRAGSIY